MYDAVSIEYAFAHLLEKPIGARGGVHDADVFRYGSVKGLGQLLDATADHLSKRISRIQFAPIESQAGGAKAQLEASIRGLKAIAKEMMQKQDADKNRESEDYHWLIIGDLVQTIASLLNHVEGKGAPRA